MIAKGTRLIYIRLLFENPTGRQKINTHHKISEDIRYQPIYTLADVAGYARVKAPTLRTWVFGRQNQRSARARYAPIIEPADPNRQDKLSFVNLIEAHVLNALRKIHGISLPKIRAAVDWLQERTNSKHPLIELQLETDNVNLFIRHLDEIVCASERGQIMIKGVMEQFLSRVERDALGQPRQFCPFTHDQLSSDTPMDIIMNPEIAFGRPVIRGTRVASAIVFERYTAGESLMTIADDYDLELAPVEEALRCEIERHAA